MIDPSGSARQEVLQGIPVHERFPEKDIWDVVTSPYYCSNMLHIPGSIQDPLIISKFTQLNKFLFDLYEDFFDRVLEPVYTRSLQRELDLTSAEFLQAKLDFMLHREYENWSNWWSIKTFGGGSSVLIYVESTRIGLNCIILCILRTSAEEVLSRAPLSN